MYFLCLLSVLPAAAWNTTNKLVPVRTTPHPDLDQINEPPTEDLQPFLQSIYLSNRSYSISPPDHGTAPSATTEHVKDLVHNARRMSMGYFSDGLMRFFEETIMKDPGDVMKVLEAGRRIGLDMQKKGELRFLEDPLEEEFLHFLRKLCFEPYGFLKKYLLLLHDSVQKRSTLCDTEINELIDYADSLIEDEDGEHIYKVIYQFTKFPRGYISAEQLCKDILEAFLKPFQKKIGTEELRRLNHKAMNVLTLKKNCYPEELRSGYIDKDFGLNYLRMTSRLRPGLMHAIETVHDIPQLSAIRQEPSGISTNQNMKTPQLLPGVQYSMDTVPQVSQPQLSAHHQDPSSKIADQNMEVLQQLHPGRQYPKGSLPQSPHRYHLQGSPKTTKKHILGFNLDRKYVEGRVAQERQASHVPEPLAETKSPMFGLNLDNTYQEPSGDGMLSEEQELGLSTDIILQQLQKRMDANRKLQTKQNFNSNKTKVNKKKHILRQEDYEYYDSFSSEKQTTVTPKPKRKKKLNLSAATDGKFSFVYSKFFKQVHDTKENYLKIIFKTSDKVIQQMEMERRFEWAGKMQGFLVDGVIDMFYYKKGKAMQTLAWDLYKRMSSRRTSYDEEINDALDYVNEVIPDVSIRRINDVTEELKAFPRVNKSPPELCYDIASTFCLPFEKMKKDAMYKNVFDVVYRRVKQIYPEVFINLDVEDMDPDIAMNITMLL